MMPCQFRTVLWKQTVVNSKVTGTNLRIVDFGWGYASVDVIIGIMRSCDRLLELRKVKVKNPGARMFFSKCIWTDNPVYKARNACFRTIEVIEFAFPEKQKNRNKYFEGWYLLIKYFPKLKSLGVHFSANLMLKHFQRRGIPNVNINEKNDISTAKELDLEKEDMQEIISKFPKLRNVTLETPYFGVLELLHKLIRLQYLTIYAENFVNFDQLLSVRKKWGVLLKLHIHDCINFNFSVFQTTCPVLQVLEVKCNMVLTSKNTLPFKHLIDAKVEYHTSKNLEWLPMLNNVKNLKIRDKTHLLDSNLRTNFLQRLLSVTFTNMEYLSLGIRLSDQEILDIIQRTPVLKLFPQPYAAQLELRPLQDYFDTSNWDMQLCCK